MNMSDMKNIIVLKDLPSNLVDEAIVVLKQNQKIRKLEYADLDNKSKDENKDKEKGNFKDHIVKEAEMLVSEYVTKLEGKNSCVNKSLTKISSKYKKLKQVNIFLAVMLFLSLAFNLLTTGA